MDIYRGARTSTGESLSEAPREPVHNEDLSSDTGPWTRWKWLSDLNISKAGADQRKSMIDIRFEEKDIIALYNGLIKGLRKDSAMLQKAEEEISKLAEPLRRIRDLTAACAPDGGRNSLKDIRKIADTALRGAH